MQIYFLFQASEHINLKVLGQDNGIIQFKIKKHTPLKKLMNAYCERAGLSMTTVRFRFDGQAINEMDTPDTLEMEEGDTIEVYQQQTGGSFNNTIRNNHQCISSEQNSSHSTYFPLNRCYICTT